MIEIFWMILSGMILYFMLKILSACGTKSKKKVESWSINENEKRLKSKEARLGAYYSNNGYNQIRMLYCRDNICAVLQRINVTDSSKTFKISSAAGIASTINLDTERLILTYIYDSIKHISDLQMLRKLWLNENNDTGLIWSYLEMYESLWDDFNLERFFREIAPKYFHFPHALLVLLENLFVHIDNFDKYNVSGEKGEAIKNDEEILQDPQWEDIVLYARDIIFLWDRFEKEHGFLVPYEGGSYKI